MYNLTTKQSTPRHPKDRSGVCLVVGTHPDWDDDFENACRKLYDEGLRANAVCAINDATALVSCNYLATCHSENLDQFLHHLNGDREIEIHTRKKVLGQEYENHYVWGTSWGGGSALFAAGTMLIIGYDIVIMCGCPMNGRDGYAVKFHGDDDESPRIGEEDFRDSTLEAYHLNMRTFKKQCPDAAKIRSMSGVTQEIFGGI